MAVVALAAAAAVVADLAEGGIRRDGLGGKSDSADSLADIFNDMKVFTLADNVADALVVVVVPGGRDLDTVQEVGIAVDRDDHLTVVSDFKCDTQRHQLVGQVLYGFGKFGAVEVEKPVPALMYLLKNRYNHRFHTCFTSSTRLRSEQPRSQASY
ncbi:protein of unknown function [Trichlorobacter ammonificans]|uniref:Uncharacterized protein n=1 Tax=Trichlorobacter ammonificans TaxID=2916410 RepID=A0ABN8HEK5_9BACT|nr:protein of unknown function [Trichlorobacter ammonificans]